MKNLFWHVYQNLEKELLEIADTIFIVDNQLDVYSMRIADLLVRTCVEIESISKELYFANGGPIPREKHPYFDKDCLGYLNDQWLLSKKKVYLSCASFFIKDTKILEMIPLEKGHHFKKDLAKWMDAYHAVKHDRMENLDQGCLRNLIPAMAALYLLNIYLKDQVVSLEKDINGDNYDWSLGSKVFSIKCHRADERVEKGATYLKREDFEECVYLSKQTDKSHDYAMSQFNMINDKIAQRSQEQIPNVILEKINSGELPVDEHLQEKINQLVPKLQSDIMVAVGRENSRVIHSAIVGLEYEGILNKNQY